MTPPRAFVAARVLVTPSRLGPKIGGVVGAALAIGGAVVSAVGASWVMLAAGLAILAVSLLVAAIRPRRLENAALRVEGEELVLGGEPTTSYALRDLAMGWTEGPNATVVTHGGERLEALFEGGEDADHFLEAVGLDAARRTVTLPLRGQIGKGTWSFIGGFVGLYLGGFLGALVGTQGSVFWVMVASMIAAAIGFRRFGDGRVVIGVDGVRVRGLRSRFIAYRDLTSVESGAPMFEATSVRLVLRDGTSLLLPVIGQKPPAVAALVRRIEAGMRASTPSSNDLAELARGGRDLATWRRDLEGLAKPTGDFRTQRIDVEMLARVLSDPGVPAERRVGAALALMPTDAEVVKRQARAASLAAADERVRIAFERVADETLTDDDVAELEAAEPELRR